MTIGSRSRVVIATILALVIAIIAGSFGAMAQCGTEITITTDPTNPVIGQAVTITWELDTQTCSDVTFAGTLDRCVKSPGSGTCDVLTGGVETSEGEPFTIEYLFAPSTAGNYTIEGSYEGCTSCDPELNPCVATPKTMTVSKASTTTSVASDINPSVTGQTVTFTATVTSDWAGGPAIGGTVTFSANKPVTWLGATTVSVSGGAASVQASCNATNSPIMITATYNGDSNYATSADGLSQTVLTDTTTSVTSSANPSVTGQWVTFTATVATVPPGTSVPPFTVPTGTVDFYADGTPIPGGQGVALTGGVAQCIAAFNAEDSSIGITATYNGDSYYAGSNGSLSPDQTVNPAGTTTSITSDAPDPSVLGQSYLVTGTVTASSPGNGHPTTGTVMVKDNSPQANTCTAPVDSAGTWRCSITSDPTTPITPVSTYNLSARYNGADNNFVASAWSTPGVPHTYTDPGTRTEVMGADTPLIVNNTATYTVEVVDTSGSPVTTGTVQLSVSPSGQGNLSATSCNLDAAGRCTFTYTPTSAAMTPHAITASYQGEVSDSGPPIVWTHEPSTGTFSQEVIRRAADMILTLNPTTAFIGQNVSVTVHVEDDTTEGAPTIPQGTVVFDDGGKNGTFSNDSPSLDSNGQCSVTYTPAAWDTDPDLGPPWNGQSQAITTITATYAGSSVHTGKTASENLVVNLRPTETRVVCSMETLLVNETETDCTITVKDIAEAGSASVPGGDIASLTTDLSGTSAVYNLSGPTPSGTDSEWTFDYLCTGLDDMAGYDAIKADFGATDGIHADSAGIFAQGIKRRPIVITLDCTADCTPGSEGASCTATVSEDTGNAGVPADLGGDLVLLGDPDDTVCSSLSGPSPSCPFHVDSECLTVNATVRFDPTDEVHLAATASESVNRSDCFDTEGGGDGTTGANCTDGCGSGGVNITQMLQNYRSLAVAINAIKLGLSQFSIVLSLFPEPIVGAGTFVIFGTTIPAKDIANAVVNQAQIALSIILMSITTDIDGDGLPDVVERHVTDTDYDNRNTDDDGMSDGLEILVAGGYYGGTRRPDPTDADSDGDGLQDGDEYFTYDTDPCVKDTDCDLLGDGDEVDTWQLADLRLHVDPLKQDTDGDGISDYIEYHVTNSPCPFGNDPDSDGDGLIDGYEDKNLDGCWGDHDPGKDPWEAGYCIGGITIGTSATQASKTIGWWETNLCDPDTDDDGLSDGEEEGLFATGEVTPKDVSTTVGVEGANLGVTVPALDSDMDNDGLSDYDEVNTYQTDPMDADTDDDTVSDYDEVATWTYADSRDHSNPREDDTDGDGLTDDVEIAEGCPHINDDDSDDDGLQDGTESWNGDGTITTGTIGNSTLQANTNPSGETDFCNPDTDGDGLTDGEEVALLGGLPVSSTTGFAAVTPQGVSGTFGVDGPALTATIPALDDDSDNDGLSDYEEVNITHTDPLDADSDNDTLSDANELLCTGGTWPNRTFQQESDPLDPDTDDDDLYDQIEYPGTGMPLRLTGGTPDNVCPYVNDDDSDNDGLQDGYEDDDHDGTVDATDKDGIWNNYVIGNSTSAGSGETDSCNPDTDGDGLSDGEEEGLIARSAIPQGVSTTFGVDGSALPITVPALDDDSDNDGLSDYEEVNITHTDPLDADSDNDTLSDANELLCTGGTWPNRTFQQESDPLDPDTDDDDLYDQIEYPGTGMPLRLTGGTPDNICPYVNNDDSDDDGLQDGTEDANHDGTWGVSGAGITIGSFGTQAGSTVAYWETDLCNPDTDGDGLLDGEEVALIGGGPIPGRPTRPVPGFNTVTPEAVSTVLPLGTSAVPSGYTHTAPSPGTGNSLIAPYFFIPIAGASIAVTIPALDVDSDNDGLSDYEEVNITGTDPLDQDSDNDTLMDTDELIATGGTVDIPGNPGTGPRRTFDQESDPLDINTDDDHLFDPQEYPGSGLSLLAGGWGGIRDLLCPYVNDDDSDDDGIQDGKVVTIMPAGVITSLGVQFTYTHYEDFIDLNDADVAHPGIMRTVATSGYGEQQTDAVNKVNNVCDPDSDGDGLNDGQEIAIGTDPDDWDTDDDGRNDWHEVTGGGPIPTDPFDPDTDDDGLLDSAEVFGFNPTNPLNADTDGDGLCDGGTGTPWMMSGDARIIINPICKSCSNPITDVGLNPCGTGIRTGSADGIGDHPNPHGYGEDKNGDGAWDGVIGQLWQSGAAGTPETDPNQYDTDGDADGDGIEVLGFSTSRQGWIPTTDLFGRTINVTYPACGCLEPLIADTDGDGLEDGYEDNDHDGNFDFFPSDFDYAPDPLPGPPQPNPNETNPCDPDTDDDDLTDYEERYQAQVFEFYANWDNDGDGLYNEDPVDGIDNDGDGLIDEDPVEPPFNPTNPLDHDTDNDRLFDGYEVKYECVAVTYTQLDNDGDALIDEDPVDGLDNDGDGLFDEDPVDFFIRFVPMLDPTCRDSDSDGWLDGLDDDPCNSELIPLLQPAQIEPLDSDGDGFADDDEIVAGTHPHDPEEHPSAYCKIDLDFDQQIDDRLWLEPALCCGIANSVAIDVNSNVLVDARVQIVAPRDVKKGDFDGDGGEDDYRYVVEYIFSNYRVIQSHIVLTIDDYNGDLVIDHAEVVRK